MSPIWQYHFKDQFETLDVCIALEDVMSIMTIDSGHSPPWYQVQLRQGGKIALRQAPAVELRDHWLAWVEAQSTAL